MSTSRLSSMIRGVASSSSKRVLSVRYASTAMRMPAMSPTMTEGGIASWKKAEGEAFSAGDVLLEIETDKATIDVEAQDDGVVGKIIAKDGSQKIPVGQIIAMLAEEGDDLSAIEVPKDLAPEASAGQPAAKKEDKKEEEPKQEAAPKESQPAQKEEQSGGEAAGHGHKEIKHPKPLFPSVSRILLESNLTSEQIYKLKGSGVRGMLTKGDVLVAIGQIKNPYGTAEKLTLDVMGPSGKRKSENDATAPKTGSAPAPEKKKEAPLDGPGLRRLILAGMNKATQPVQPIIPHSETQLPRSLDAEFDAILAPYAILLPPPQPKTSIPTPDLLNTPKKDEWAGLF